MPKSEADRRPETVGGPWARLPGLIRDARERTFVFDWSALFALWLSVLGAWLLPVLNWPHHRIMAALLQVGASFPGCVLLAIGYVVVACPRRETAAGGKNIGYIPRLDHLRFFAASLVVLYHYYHSLVPTSAVNPYPIFDLLNEGSSGVDLFFVISGFIFGLISYQKRIRYFDFLLSRVIRIYPLYLFAIVLTVGIHQGQYTPLDFAMLLMPVFDLGVLPSGLPDFGQLWSIGLEFQFYLIFPFLADFILRQGYRYLVGIMALAIAVRAFTFWHMDQVRDLSYWSLPGRIDEFVLGMLGAWAFATRPKAFAHPLHLAAALAVLLGCIHGLEVWGGFDRGGKSAWWIIWPTVEGAFWTYLVVSYLSCHWRLPRFIDFSLTQLGQLSYSIYVMHSFALVWAVRVIAPRYLTAHREFDAAFGGLAICLPLAVCLALPTYHLIERPFLMYRRRYVETPVPAPI